MIIVKETLITIFLLVALPDINSVARAQANFVPTNTRLSQMHIESFFVKDISIEKAIEQLSVQQRIPIGMICIPDNDDNSSESLTVNLARSTVAEILNIIITESSGYEWRELDGVINITPQNKDISFMHGILDLKVENFSIEKKTPRFLIRSRLLEVPQVVQIARANNKRSFAGQYGCGFQSCYIGNNPDFSAVFSNLTIREILNSLAVNSGMYFWRTFEYEGYYSIIF